MAEFPESHRDLLQTPVGVLATQGADGYPQVSALWFVVDDGTVKLSLNTTRQKMKNLQQHAECTLFLMDPANPYRTMEIRARAEIDPGTSDEVVTRVEQKYGAEVRQNDRPGEQRVAVTLHPIKINTWG
ncbi:MAG TPA: PPOX class F420-dependent oxidoreductase [Chloroflexota bacterium]